MRTAADRKLPNRDLPAEPDDRASETGIAGVHGHGHDAGASVPDPAAAGHDDVSRHALFLGSPLPMYIFDRDSLRFLAVNDAALKFYGHERPRFLSMTLLDIRPARDHAKTRAAARAEAADPPNCAHLNAAGGERIVSVRWWHLLQNGRPACLATIIDQTEQHRIENELRRTRTFLDSVVDSIPVAVFVKDMQDDGRYVLYNRAGEKLTGLGCHDIIGKTDGDVFDPVDAARFAEQDRAVVSQGELHIIETEPFRRADGEVRTIRSRKLPIGDISHGRRRYVLGVAEDITERLRSEARVSYLAHHDALTDLPNRVLFRERLDAALTRAIRYDELLAVLCLDLDNFKGINDTLGHPIGDGLLRAVGDRLRQTLRTTDSAARLGGDEFAILQVPVRAIDDVAGLAARLIDTLSAPFEVEGHQFVVGASIGIAVGPINGADADQLLKCADIALYRAKADGRGIFRFFEPAMNAQIQSRRALELGLRRALAQGELELHYQPLIDIASDKVIGCEALLRWRDPERGLLPPGDFIPLAEEIGLIVPLGSWVLRQACTDAAAWPSDIRVSVNVSPLQFNNRSLTASVLSALAASGLPPDRLELEITESVLLADNEANLAILHQLHGLGVHVSLDDFGTGYSSLGYLRSFPFSKIKIDRSFIRDLETSSHCLAIIRAVTGLGTSLGVTTTAEGVETIEQFDRLRTEGCTEVQGFLFSRPVPAGDIPGIIRDRRMAAHLDPSAGPDFAI